MAEQTQTRYALTWTNHVAEVPRDRWNALAEPLKTPFLEWEWLWNAEQSGSATARKGWLPNHLLVWRDGALVAAAPLYIKGHSYGEFVFDHQWADLAHRLGVHYYPKLLGMSPFTPATGYRFLIDPDEDETALTHLMLREIDRFCERNSLSGCNFLFVDPDWRPIVEDYGYLAWQHHSYQWQNRDYQTFDDYLGEFNANQRRNIKRERKAVTQAELNVKVYAGEEIPHRLFPLMYNFYSSTCDKFMWGSKYLTKRFFELLHDNYRHRVVFIAAESAGREDHPIGMSFCIRKGDQLYGRYWGADQDIDCLHFEACYYSPIEYAIQQGIRDFDPGAGGQHKKRRGFPAVGNTSLHRIYHPRLVQILKPYIKDVNQMEAQEMEAINAELPFKQK
ncbi:GNAT family N-acetyltransferase [Leptolyngbya sp. FACHB-261]|uniref:GNAT family N-acetyltransferase n=1 Tax=Leptolyngbya sp. FACHB-261 TaxID=2692806 RepID=UPI001683A5AD|nr:GNAT family N-acetyltransferase [Leptolyngbya sp. FACHB-261]MBD2100569.1 N-acetyltransferase [Leptolyngbya sp. FACHB-261]